EPDDEIARRRVERARPPEEPRDPRSEKAPRQSPEEELRHEIEGAVAVTRVEHVGIDDPEEVLLEDVLDEELVPADGPGRRVPRADDEQDGTEPAKRRERPEPLEDAREPRLDVAEEAPCSAAARRQRRDEAVGRDHRERQCDPDRALPESRGRDA